MNNHNEFKSLALLDEHPKLKRVAKLLILTFFLVIIGVIFIPWQQTASGHGKVVALSPDERAQVINAPISGRLSKWYVHDGSYVKKGDPIVALVDNDPQLLHRLSLEKEAVLLRIKTSKQATAASLRNVQRQKRLYKEGISSRRKYEQAKFEYIKYQNELAKAKIELANVDVRIARQRSQLVRSPLSGTIIQRLSGKVNVLVKEADRLALLVPDTQSRAVELWLDGNDIPLIRKGQHVRLQFEGWPAIQFSGWPSVAVGTFGGRVELVDPTDNGKGLFRILVVPERGDKWPGPKFLRQGVRANGWVLLNRVHLWFELWRRANGFPPAVNEQQFKLRKIARNGR